MHTYPGNGPDQAQVRLDGNGNTSVNSFYLPDTRLLPRGGEISPSDTQPGHKGPGGPSPLSTQGEPQPLALLPELKDSPTGVWGFGHVKGVQSLQPAYPHILATPPSQSWGRR